MFEYSTHQTWARKNKKTETVLSDVPLHWGLQLCGIVEQEKKHEKNKEYFKSCKMQKEKCALNPFAINPISERTD